MGRMGPLAAQHWHSPPAPCQPAELSGSSPQASDWAQLNFYQLQMLAAALQAKKLEAEVLAPMQRWTTAYNTVQTRMTKLEGLRLEVDSRRWGLLSGRQAAGCLACAIQQPILTGPAWTWLVACGAMQQACLIRQDSRRHAAARHMLHRLTLGLGRAGGTCQ